MPPNLAIEPCPHCGSNADVRPSADVRFKCEMCGKARIPLATRLGASSKQANTLLKESHGSKVARILWQVATVGLGGLAAFLGLLSFGASALFDFGWFGNSTALVFTLVPALVAVLSFSFSRRAKHTSQLKLDEAWQIAAARIVQRLGGHVEAGDLAKALGIDGELATQLLAEAEVHQLLAMDESEEPVKVRVKDDADIETAAWEEASQAVGDLPTQAVPARKE